MWITFSITLCIDRLPEKRENNWSYMARRLMHAHIVLMLYRTCLILISIQSTDLPWDTTLCLRPYLPHCSFSLKKLCRSVTGHIGYTFVVSDVSYSEWVASKTVYTLEHKMSQLSFLGTLVTQPTAAVTRSQPSIKSLILHQKRVTRLNLERKQSVALHNLALTLQLRM